MRRRANWLHHTGWWLRQAMPPAWTLLLLCGFLLVLEALALWTAWFDGNWNEAMRMHGLRDALLAGVAGAYGCYRVWQTHPLFLKEYREFLARTPWDRTHPLPLGPLHVVPQDMLLLGLLLAPLLFRPQLSPAWVPLAFGFAVLAIWGLALVVTRQTALAWATVFGLGLSVRLGWSSPWAALLAVVFIYPLAWHGIWRSLADFPWHEALNPAGQNLNRRFIEFNSFGNAPREAGESGSGVAMAALWPWNVLSLDRPERLVVPAHGWAWSLQAGWWIYALMSGLNLAHPASEAEAHSLTMLALTVAAAVCMSVRLLIYSSSHHSPLSLWGRIRTGPLIIPAYDVVAVTPLLVLVAGSAAYPILFWLGAPPAIGAGVAVAFILGLILTGGPRRRQWQLTAPARLMPPAQAKQTVEAI